MRVGSVLLLLILVMVALGYLLSDAIYSRQTLTLNEGSISSRLERLSSSLVDTSKSLNETSLAIAGIELEIERTKQVVADLEQKKILYEQAITLDREQVEAIAYILNLQQEEQNKKSIWINTGLGFLTNFITAILSIYLEYKVGFVRRWLKKNS